MKRIFCISIILLIVLSANSQISRDSSLNIPMFYAAYSYQFPEGDLKDRFGNNSNIGGGFLLKTKPNLLIGVEGNYLFSNNLTDEATSIFDNIKTSDGQIIDQNGEFATVLLSERGFFIGGKLGYIIPVIGPNVSSGITVIGSVGLLQHKIRIENDGNRAPQILDEYKKGYDRLTNGIAISEFIGYTYFSSKYYLNFFAGVEFYQAWTQNRRDINIDTMKKDTQKRNDFLYSIKFGFIVPIYKRMPKEYYYN